MSRTRLLAVLLCFFLSGAAGLIYQVAWGKALGLVFGHTVYAISTILAVFMGGLAFGSAVLGRWSERFRNPVALYGWMELLIAAAGALSLLGLAGVRLLYLSTFHAVAGSGVALLLLRFLGAAIVLLIPTFLMGGTLPVLVSGLTRSTQELGVRVSRLYWVNTLGAVAGTFAAGFWILPALGLRLTVAVAVALNIVAGLLALLLARGQSAERSLPGEAAEAAAGAPVRLTTPAFLLTGFAAVGATAMAYEICWTRLLATTLGSSTYAFTLMLGTFLTGIVLGSILFEILDRRWIRTGHEITLATFATTQTLTALAALGFLVFFQHLPELVPPILQATRQSFGGLVLAQFATSALAMLPAAIVFGFNFPVVTVLIAGREETAGHHAAAVGRAYAANTLGAILGATLTGFVLIPLLGSFRVVAVAAIVNLLLAAYLALRMTPRGVLVSAVNLVLVIGVAAAGWSGAFYDRALATFGTVLYWDRYADSHLTLPEMAATTDVIYVDDGLNATISVARTEDYLAVRTNGKVDASNKDRITQLLSGHLGMVLHPQPRRVLVVGFGSGMTVSAVAQHPDVEQIDCVEIEAGMIRAAEYLRPLNRDVLKDPRVRVVIDDARNFLLTTRERYDVIISEPSNPWIAGVAALFTEEFYREARARLNPGGIFVQWVQAYSLFPEDFRMVLATFVPQFPQATLWRGEPPDYLLVGQTRQTPLTLERLRRLWSNAAIRGDMESLGMRAPEALLAFHRLDDADLRRLASSPYRNTDDRTLLEYHAPRALLASGLEDKNRQMIWEHRTTYLSDIVQLEDKQAAHLSAAQALVAIEDDDAVYFMETLPEPQSPSAEFELLRGRYRLNLRDPGGARQAFERALQLDPKLLEAAWGLGESARQQLDLDLAELMFRQVLARNPKHAASLLGMMRVKRTREKWEEAIHWQRQYLEATPEPKAEDYARLGELLMRVGRSEDAGQEFSKALQIDPYNYAAHRNLGEMFREQRQWQRALEHFEFSVRFHPDMDPLLYVSLAEVYRALNRPQAAVDALRKGARIFPNSKEIQRLLPASG
jgi:spermidine synthase